MTISIPKSRLGEVIFFTIGIVVGFYSGKMYGLNQCWDLWDALYK